MAPGLSLPHRRLDYRGRLQGVSVFPDPDREPACGLERAHGFTVTFGVSLDLAPPELSVRLRPRPVFWTGMPETAVDEHRDTSAGEHDVGLSSKRRDRPPVDDVAKSSGEQQLSKSSLGLRVMTGLPPHSVARAVHLRLPGAERTPMSPRRCVGQHPNAT